MSLKLKNIFSCSHSISMLMMSCQLRLLKIQIRICKAHAEHEVVLNQKSEFRSDVKYGHVDEPVNSDFCFKPEVRIQKTREASFVRSKTISRKFCEIQNINRNYFEIEKLKTVLSKIILLSFVTSPFLKKNVCPPACHLFHSS